MQSQEKQAGWGIAILQIVRANSHKKREFRFDVQLNKADVAMLKTDLPDARVEISANGVRIINPS